MRCLMHTDLQIQTVLDTIQCNSLLECYFISINELTLKKKKLNNNFVDGNTIFRIS